MVVVQLVSPVSPVLRLIPKKAALAKLFMVILFITPIAFSLLVLKKVQEEKRKLDNRPSCCGPNCRLLAKDRPTEHYDEKYFNWQTELGIEKAKVRDWQSFMRVGKNETVADLGAGGGHILAALDVETRIAVEVNAQARSAMKKLYPGKIQTYQYPEEVPDDSVDLLFSTSAIEHFECPLTELREMAKKVKIGGRVIVGIKNEGMAIGVAPVDNDKNQHIYTWSFQELQNLITMAGFKVTGFEPTYQYALDVHAKRLKYPESFQSHDKADIYIWAKGVKV